MITDFLNIQSIQAGYEKTINCIKKYVPSVVIDTFENVAAISVLPLVANSQRLSELFLTTYSLKQECIATAGPTLRCNEIMNAGFAVGILIFSASTLCCLPASIVINKIYSDYIKSPYIGNQIKEIVDHSSHFSKSALIIRAAPAVDHNGALNRHCAIDLTKKLAQNYSLSLVQIANNTDWREISDHLKEKQKYDMIWIHAHGCPEDMKFNTTLRMHKDLEPTYNWLQYLVKKRGKIVLLSCSTAQGEDNIARAISKACPTAKVYGNAGLFSLGTKMTDEYIPKYDKKKIYVNGTQKL